MKSADDPVKQGSFHDQRLSTGKKYGSFCRRMDLADHGTVIRTDHICQHLPTLYFISRLKITPVNSCIIRADTGKILLHPYTGNITAVTGVT